MRYTLAILLCCLMGIASCKKPSDSNTTVPPPTSGTLAMTIDSIPFNANLLLDTVLIQLDTQIASAYTNPVSFSIPHKRMVFIARDSNGYEVVWNINDYNQPDQGACLRAIPYTFGETSTDYLTVYGTKFRSGFSLSYFINQSPRRYFEGGGGNITITACDEANHTVSGTFNVYTDNHDYPNEHHILMGTFTNVPFRVTTINKYPQGMTAIVNGSPWAANGISTYIGKTADYGIINKGFRATGVSVIDNSEIEISIFEARNGNQGDCIRTTTFLDYKRSTDTVFSGGLAIVCNTIINYITPSGEYSAIDSASVQITNCDEASKTVSGTYNYYGKTTDGTKMVAITNGVFTNLHYTVY